ncbi:MAG TPA: hypothetical protein VFH62_07245, partial [Dehalococcoidia bacterium]|nr:hypothetical protein [Dehalococcoidia bacterium]
MSVRVCSEEAHDGKALPFELALAFVTLEQGNHERNDTTKFQDNVDRLLYRLSGRNHVVHDRDAPPL